MPDNASALVETTAVFSRCPDESFCTLPRLPIYRRSDTGGRAAALFRLTLPKRAATVEYAELRMLVCGGVLNGQDSVRLYAFMNLEDFAPCSVTWRTRPSTYPRPFAEAAVAPTATPQTLCLELTKAVRQWEEGTGLGGFTLVTASGTGLAIERIAHPPRLLLRYRLPPSYPPTGLFEERCFTLEGTAQVEHTPAVETALSQTNTFFVQNLGESSVLVQLQISPDGILFIDDPQIITLESGQTQALNAYRFARYMRAAAMTLGAHGSMRVRLWYQSQQLVGEISPLSYPTE